MGHYEVDLTHTPVCPIPLQLAIKAQVEEKQRLKREAEERRRLEEAEEERRLSEQRVNLQRQYNTDREKQRSKEV